MYLFDFGDIQIVQIVCGTKTRDLINAQFVLYLRH